MGHSYNGPEARKHVRLFKNYSLLFNFKDLPDKKSDVSSIKDISKGGLRFTTSQYIKHGTHLVFEIGIPYIAPKRLILEGLVLLCKEISPRLVFEIRAQFISIDGESLQVLEMIEKLNLKDNKNYGLP